MKRVIQNGFSLLALSLLLLIPGCTMDKSCCPSCDKGKAVIQFGSRIVVDEANFDKALRAVIASNNILQQVLPYLPVQEVENLLNQIAQGLSHEYAMLQWIADEGISTTPEYQAQLAELYRAVERNLANNKFQQILATMVDVKDDEPKTFYDAEKMTNSQFQQPPYLEQQGGVKVEVVHAKSLQDAENIKKKLASVTNIKKAAEELKAQYEDLGFVTEHTLAVDEGLRKALFALKKFPATDLIKVSDKLYFVFKAHKKQDAKYIDYDKLDAHGQEYIKQLIRKKKDERCLCKENGRAS
jgi:hypothetical protein